MEESAMLYHTYLNQGRKLKFCLGGCKHALDRLKCENIFGPAVQH